MPHKETEMQSVVSKLSKLDTRDAPADHVWSVQPLSSCSFSDHFLTHLSPLDLFQKAKDEMRPLYVSAPMVRYSKLAFRQTITHYGVDLAYTPMILAKEFNRSHYARDSDFTLPPLPTSVPTIVQLGASSPVEFARTTSMLMPYCSGVDLNCGCPQSWACAESIGAALMEKPELVCEIVRAARKVIREEGWEGRRTMSVKIRIHKDLEYVSFV